MTTSLQKNMQIKNLSQQFMYNRVGGCCKPQELVKNHTTSQIVSNGFIVKQKNSLICKSKCQRPLYSTYYYRDFFFLKGVVVAKKKRSHQEILQTQFCGQNNQK